MAWWPRSGVLTRGRPVTFLREGATTAAGEGLRAVGQRRPARAHGRRLSGWREGGGALEGARGGGGALPAAVVAVACGSGGETLTAAAGVGR